MKWLRSFIARFKTVRLGKFETYKDGDSLSADEVRYIENTGRCPDCVLGKFLRGPSAGLCINYMCEDCGSKFNIASGIMYMRISNSSLRDELWDSYKELIKYKTDL